MVICWGTFELIAKRYGTRQYHVLIMCHFLKFYEPGGQNPYPDLEDLQSIDLISFAYQIASGMVLCQ